jgi:hypothetical protein
MKYFFDTEFIEQPGSIELISIGIKAEDGRTYYAVNTECDCSKASDWVKENVLMKLPEYSGKSYNDLRSGGGSHYKKKTIQDIKSDLLMFCGQHTNGLSAVEQCEFYAYFADYDWVVFCWIFGRMIDLPKGFPKWCIDLKQMMWERGLRSEWKDQHVPKNENEHHALADAEWGMELYQQIIKHSIRP